MATALDTLRTVVSNWTSVCTSCKNEIWTMNEKLINVKQAGRCQAHAKCYISVCKQIRDMCPRRSPLGNTSQNTDKEVIIDEIKI